MEVSAGRRTIETELLPDHRDIYDDLRQED